MKATNEIRYRGIDTARYPLRATSVGTFLVVVSLIAALHFAFWAAKNPHAVAPSVEERLPSVSYNRFALKNAVVSEARIREDLTAIAVQARAVRTYSSTQGLELVPQIAAELGLKVSLGI